MNQLLIHWLEKISEDYELDESKDVYKKRTINKALYAIKQYDKEIKTKKDIKEFQKKIKGIGPGTADKIQIIIETGKYPLKFVDKIEKSDTKVSKIKIETPLQALKKITGIGDSKAKKLIEKGIANIDMLKTAIEHDEIKVTDHIKIGVKYYYDFEQRIPRSEVDIFNLCFKDIFSKLNLEYQICGSYRRGKETCGDMDILVTSPNLKTDDDIEKSKIMNNLITSFLESNILLKDGTLTPDAIKKFMGTCRLLTNNSLARRLDIRIIKIDSYPAALMYFTGSKEFNLRMRNKAISMDMLLNEYGLFKKDKEIIPISSEEDIFKLLNEDYLEPTQR